MFKFLSLIEMISCQELHISIRGIEIGGRSTPTTCFLWLILC